MIDETIQSSNPTFPTGDLKKWVESQDYLRKHAQATGETEQIRAGLQPIESHFSPDKWEAYQRLKRAEAMVKMIEHEGSEYKAKINRQIASRRKKVGNLTPREIVTRRFEILMEKPGVQTNYRQLYERMLLYLDRPANAPSDPLQDLEASFPDTEAYGLEDYQRWQPLKTIAFFKEHSPRAAELISKMQAVWQNPKRNQPFTVTKDDITTILSECPNSDPTKIIKHFVDVMTTLFGRVGFHEHDDIGAPVPYMSVVDFSGLDKLFIPYELQSVEDLWDYSGSADRKDLDRIFEKRAIDQKWVTTEVVDLLSSLGALHHVIQVEGDNFSLEDELELLDDLCLMTNIKKLPNP